MEPNPNANRTRSRRGLSIFLLILAFAGGCGSAESEQPISAAQEVSETAAAETTAATSAPTAASTHVDLSAIEKVDVAALTAVETLYDQDRPEHGWAMPAGSWSTGALATPIAFRLSSDARLTDEALGRIHMELLGVDGTQRGSLRIIAPIAINSSDGPIPINLVDARSEFEDTTVIERALFDGPDRDGRWTDFIVEASPETESFVVPCPRDPQVRCTDGIETLGGPVYVQQSVMHRAVVQTIAETTIWVLATAADPTDTAFLDEASELAATIVPVTASDAPTESTPLSRLGLRAETLPAGVHFIEVDGVRVEIALDADLPDTRLHVITANYFGLQPVTEIGDLFVMRFQGFPTDWNVDDPALENYTSDEFVEALGSKMIVHEHGPALVGGADATAYTSELSDTAGVSCTEFDIPEQYESERCLIWSTDRWVAFEDETDGRSFYLPETGLIVIINVTPGSTLEEVSAAFQPVLDGLTIVPPE